LQDQELEQIEVFDPVPLPIVRVANRERAQLLVESPVRSALQFFLRAWDQALQEFAQQQRRTYTLEVDPLVI